MVYFRKTEGRELTEVFSPKIIELFERRHFQGLEIEGKNKLLSLKKEKILKR